MRGSPRQSLLVRLLGVYMLFTVAVLGMGFVVNLVMQRQLRADAQAADVALGQAIARDVDAKLNTARRSLERLSELEAVRQGDTDAMEPVFLAFQAARPDLDRVYWLDAAGIMRVSVPANVRTLDTNFSQRRLFQHASGAADWIIEAGIVDLSTYHAVAAIARPVRANGVLRGVLGTNLLLDDFSAALKAIVDEQARQGKPLLISLVDAQGVLVASPDQERLLQPMLDELPGAADALAGRIAAQMAPGPRGQEWLFSAVPVPSSGWAVVVQRPATDVLATVTTFNSYLLLAAVLFAASVLLFWADLMRLVIRPLQHLAADYRALPPAADVPAGRAARLAVRADEVGGLARALERLRRDVGSQMRELRTLLDTSKVVVETLDPHHVAEAIIHEVRRLVDVQAAAVLVMEESGQLRVLASEGRSAEYAEALRLRPRDAISPAAQALREDRPVQMVAGAGVVFPPVSYAEGFRALLALPIRSPHAEGVVLVVHRTAPESFGDHDVELLMTFANYAALAWEHAVLYERSDVRLREEQQTLAAIMRSMSDGLVLAGVDGTVLYANPGAAALAGSPSAALEGTSIDQIHATLRKRAAAPAVYDRDRARAEAGELAGWLLEIGADRLRQAIQLRVFDVRDEAGQPIGRGLLLRDVTHEQEVAQFKTTLLGAVGHELRTPLAVIKMHASTLLQQDVEWSPAEQRQFVREINDEADRLAQLVSTLLDLSRIEAGLQQLDRAPCRIDRLVARTLRRLHEPIARLELAIAPELPPVEADEARLEVVLRNLLANALAYGNGLVRIAAEQRGTGLLLRVTDDGPGVAPDELPHLFERFYRAERGQQRRAGGIGLGLAICKAFVEAHGGTIWAESGAHGTTFAFLIPLEAPAAPVPVEALAA